MAEFQQVGNNGPNIAGSECQMVAASPSRIYTIETGLIRALDWDGADWAQTGNSFAISGLSSSEGKGIALHDSGEVTVTYHASSFAGRIRRLSFDGTDWAAGNETNVGGNLKTCCSINIDDVVVFNDTSNELRAWEYVGGFFQQINGSNFYTINASASHVAIAQMTSDRIAFLDDLDEEIRMLRFDGAAWSQIGNGLAIPAFSGQISFVKFTENVVILSYGSSLINLIEMYEFDGSDWVKTFSQEQAVSAAMATLSDTQIAFRYAPFLLTTLEYRENPVFQVTLQGNATPVTLNAGGLATCRLAPEDEDSVVIAKSGLSSDGFIRVYNFDGIDWSQVGNSYTSVPDFNSIGVALLGDGRIGYIDNTVDLRALDFSNPDWIEVGTPFDLGFMFVDSPALTSLDSQQGLLAHCDSPNDSLRTYQFDGASWSQVGDSLSTSPMGTAPIAALSGTKMVMYDSDTRALRTFNWDGSDWTEEGAEFALYGINLTGQLAAIAALSSTRIVFQSNSGSFLRIYDYLGDNEWEMKYGNLYIGNRAGIVGLSPTKFATVDDGTDTIRMWYISESVATPSLFWTELGPNAEQGAS